MLGGSNPFPFRLGGGRTPLEAMYRALRSAVGVGMAGADDSIVEKWRRAKARGLVAARGTRALTFEALGPAYATHLLPMYERLLARHFPADTEIQTKRDELQAQWVSAADATLVEEELQRIDPTITVTATDPDTTRDAQGAPRAFGGAQGAFNLTNGVSGPEVDSFPNFSDRMRFYIHFPHDSGTFPEASRQKLAAVKKAARRIIPSWCDFVLYARDDGFVLDRDLLDVTAFGS